MENVIDQNFILVLPLDSRIFMFAGTNESVLFLKGN